MKTIDVDRNKLVDLIKRSQDGHIKYRLGAKCDLLNKPEEITHIDCSGYVRWLIYQISGVDIRDGSWVQRKWIQSQGFKPTDYDNCALNDDRLRIAFMNAQDGKAGHVWLIANGMTIESYGGKGPGRRAWNHRTLKRGVDFTFVLTEDM